MMSACARPTNDPKAPDAGNPRWPHYCGRLSLFLFVLGTILCAAEAWPQYLFLDADGDGRNGRNDRPPRSGWANVDVWLQTDMNRDGTPAPEGRPSRLCCYQLVLRAHSGTVAWGEYTNLLRGATVTRGPLTDSVSFYVAVSGPASLPPGPHHLGRLRLRRLWGEPVVAIVPCTFVGGLLQTAFRDEADGRPWRLGPTLNMVPQLHVERGDWQDADGLGAPPEPRRSAGPITVPTGILYLGHSRMEPPYQIAIVDGRVVVNGLALRVPPPTRQRHVSPITDESKAKYTAGVFADAVILSARSMAAPKSLVSALALECYRSSAVVDSAFANSPDELAVYYRNSRIGPEHVLLAPLPWQGTRVDPDDRLPELLRGWASQLEEGRMLILGGLGYHEVIPPPRALEADRLARKIQTGGPLSLADSLAAHGLLRGGLRRWAHPEPLERVGP